MTQTSTDECVHDFISPWWVKAEDAIIAPGRLLWAFVKHVDQQPMALVAKGRTDDAGQHALAECEIVPINSDKLFVRSQLPVASLPCYEREVRAVYRAKKRPVLALSLPGAQIDRQALGFKGKPQNLTAKTILVAPYYGVDEGTGRRAGWPQAFVSRVKRCEYPQFAWDSLPISQVKESILRLDHIQPISSLHIAYEPTEWTLSEEALRVMQEWVAWHLLGESPDIEDESSSLALLRTVLGEE